MGQIAHAGSAAPSAAGRLLAAAVVTVLAAGAAAAVVLPGGPPAAAAVTTVHAPRVATIVHADGRSTVAREGAVLHPGEALRTGDGGYATLLTDGRREHVAAGSSVLVRDGERQQLRAGAVVVDVRSGPAVDVLVSGATVRADDGDVVRIEHGFTVRVGALAGDTRVSTAAGRSAAVPALHQVRVNADALPDDAAAPLELVDDAAERATNLPVVLDDVLLRRWARGVSADTGARPRLTAAVAAFTRTKAFATQCELAPGAAISERVLPLAVARSSHTRMSLGDRYGRALCYRDEGASWGVVAHLMETTAVRTLAQIDALQSDRLLALGGDTGLSRTVVGAPAPADTDPTSGSSPDRGSTATPPDDGGSAPPPSSGPTTPPSPGPSSPPPSGSPTPPPTLPPPDTGVIGDVVGAVAGLLVPPPEPVPAPTPPSGDGSGSGLLGLGALTGGDPLLAVRLPLLTVGL